MVSNMQNFTSHMTETEVKILNVSYPLLIRKLKKLGATKQGVVYIRDWYVDTSHKTLKKSKKSARLRSYGGENFEITIKTKKKWDGVRVREEQNISVPSLQAGELMLQMFGLEHKRYKEKIRVTYILDGVHFDIDFYDDMPPVLEIEGEAHDIQHWIRKLRLHKHKKVTWGTKKLFKHYGKKVEKLGSQTIKNT